MMLKCLIASVLLSSTVLGMKKKNRLAFLSKICLTANSSKFKRKANHTSPTAGQAAAAYVKMSVSEVQDAALIVRQDAAWAMGPKFRQTMYSDNVYKSLCCNINCKRFLAHDNLRGQFCDANKAPRDLSKWKVVGVMFPGKRKPIEHYYCTSQKHDEDPQEWWCHWFLYVNGHVVDFDSSLGLYVPYQTYMKQSFRAPGLRFLTFTAEDYTARCDEKNQDWYLDAEHITVGRTDVSAQLALQQRLMAG